jgi:hypothetical protein
MGEAVLVFVLDPGFESAVKSIIGFPPVLFIVNGTVA